MLQALLLEIGCEDLPARYVLPLSEALATGIADGLAKRGVAIGEVQRYATPRRLAVAVANVASPQPEQLQERYGPAEAAAFKDGNPTPAALGFAKSCGVGFEAIGRKDGKLHYSRRVPGQPTAALLPEIFEETLKRMDELVPKRMRWGGGSETFVRPVSWLLALLGSEVIPLARFGLNTGRITYGHRFHAPAAITLNSPSDYPAALRAAYVEPDFALRQARCAQQIQALASQRGGYARVTPELLEEVTALVEHPVAIAGQMEARFLKLPPEVIVATVETNQRYFTVFKDAALSELTPHFITVANIESRDVAQVIQGNERVIRPRLTDAMFFYEQDLKQPFAHYRAKLETATYQKDLGTVDAKVNRIQTIAAGIAHQVGADTQTVFEAADLCKNDLHTKMVFEFPELQGLMGGYYAAANGCSAQIANAISQHYLPSQAGTPIPSSKEGQVLALADKLDTLAGIFAIGQKPTASKDPYALRRCANGVLRICIEGNLALDLRWLLERALGQQPTGKKDAATLNELLDFVMERLRAYTVTGGVSTEMFEAVKALGLSQPLDVYQRVQTLQAFVQLPAAANLAAAHKRVRNILKQAGETPSAIDAALFADPSEHALHRALLALPEGGDYTTQLLALATLREPVDAFFAAVMVNDPNPAVRSNRLALLSALDERCRSVADISLLPS